MELSIKLELNDEQYADFSRSAKDAIETVMKDPSFVDNIGKLFTQAVLNFIQSEEGKKLARESVVNYRWYRNDFATYLTEKASEDVLNAAKEPFKEVFLEALNDSDKIRKAMDMVLMKNLSLALTSALNDRLVEMTELSIVTNSRIDGLVSEISRIAGTDHCF